jgi:hypothetical protein
MDVPGTMIKQCVGKAVRLMLADGSALAAHLLSFDGRSLWLIAGGEDRFVALRDVQSVVETAGQPA